MGFCRNFCRNSLYDSNSDTLRMFDPVCAIAQSWQRLMKWQRRNMIIVKRLQNIMVILKNIKRTENSISTSYYPEGKEPKGFMKMRVFNEKIVEHESVSMFAVVHVK